MAGRSVCRLAELRALHGLRLDDVAVASGCSERTLRRLESGDLTNSRLLTLVRVAFAMGVTVVELVPALGAEPPRAGLIQTRTRDVERSRIELAERRRAIGME